MATIKVTTKIKAPITICFDLARSIDLHKISTSGSNEEAVAGRISGLIGLNEEVTWQATHLGIRQELSSKITRLEYPVYFRDEMLKGAFKRMEHDHFFEEKEGVTIMEDRFCFESPLGAAGKIFNTLFLNTYLEKLLSKRNAVIKEYAESLKWKLILK